MRYFREYAKNDAGWDDCPLTFQRTIPAPVRELFADAAAVFEDYLAVLPDDGKSLPWVSFFDKPEAERNEMIEDWRKRHEAACHHGGSDAQ